MTIPKALEEAFRQDAERILERQKVLDAGITSDTPGSDVKLPANQQHDYVSDLDSKKKNFDQKKYLFPESFNALRRELEQYYPTFFVATNPYTGYSPAWAMVYDAPGFVGVMNGALNLAAQMDSANIDGICKTFLNALRIKRGVRPFSD